MINKYSFAISVLLTSSLALAQGFAGCLNYFPNQAPPVVPKSYSKTYALCFADFAVLYSGNRKTPIFAVEKLNAARLANADETRTNRFYEEARLPSSARATLNDYRGSNYDRGHMAPAADMPTPEAMAQSFSLANMVPQDPALNRGIWAKRVEKATRDYASRAKGDVFVFTGPLYLDSPVLTIGENQVHVPSHIFKLVYDQTLQKSWVYIVANNPSAQMSAPKHYSTIVEASGINFLPNQ
jgi:endonuclease G